MQFMSAKCQPLIKNYQKYLVRLRKTTAESAASQEKRAMQTDKCSEINRFRVQMDVGFIIMTLAD